MAKLKTGSLFKPKSEAPPASPQPAEAPGLKRGKHLISGLFEEPTYVQFTVLAAERGMKRQELVREALNDLFVKYGKPPIA